MSPKTILTVVGSEQPADDVKSAISLCSEFDCHLAVAVLGVALPAAATAYGAVPADAWSEERERGRALASEKATEIEALLQAASISGDVAPYFCEEGLIPDVVGTRARYADLALVRPAAGMDKRIAEKALEGLLYQSARPFVFAPEGVNVSLKPKRVMVAWNASKEAAGVVHASLDMLATTENVHIVLVDPIASEFDQGEEPGADLATYLARHGVSVTVDALPSSGRSVADVLLQHATDISADLIMAGAYGHSRLREFLFGGVTRDLLANTHFPVLMSH